MRPPLLGTSQLAYFLSNQSACVEITHVLYEQSQTGTGEELGGRGVLGKHPEKQDLSPANMGRLLRSTVKTKRSGRPGGRQKKQKKQTKNLNEAKKAECPLEVTTQWGWWRGSGAGAGDAMIN